MSDLTFVIGEIVIKGKGFKMFVLDPPKGYPADAWDDSNQNRLQGMGWKITDRVIETSPKNKFNLSVSFAEGGFVNVNLPDLGVTRVGRGFACEFSLDPNDPVDARCGPL